MKHPLIQLFEQEYENRNKIAQQRIFAAQKGFIARLKHVLKSYQQRRQDIGKIPAQVFQSWDVTKEWINNINYGDLYHPMFKNIERGGKEVPEWNVTDDDWKAAKEKYKLTDKQVQEYRDLTEYVLDTFEQFFVDSKSVKGTAL